MQVCQCRFSSNFDVLELTRKLFHRRNAYGAMQRHNVGEGDVDAGMPTVTLTMWADGIFSIDDGVNPVEPRNPTTDPVARKFMEDVR